MREHQIVITLKPEQFQAVQKLAKASGARSMGIFVRKELLSALGVEVRSAEAGGEKLTVSDQGGLNALSQANQVSQVAQEPTRGADPYLDLTRIAQDIRRMRADLQDYIQPPAELVPLVEELDVATAADAHASAGASASMEVIPNVVPASAFAVNAAPETIEQKEQIPAPIEEDTLAIIAEALISGTEKFNPTEIAPEDIQEKIQENTQETSFVESPIEAKPVIEEAGPAPAKTAPKPLSADPLDDLLNDYIDSDSIEDSAADEEKAEFQVTVPVPSNAPMPSDKDVINEQNKTSNGRESDPDNTLKQKPRTPGFGLSGGPPPKRDQ